MARANRHFLPGHVWHITHRCHQKAFLLKFSKDRANWLRWLFEAKKRHGLCVLNYIVTSNHIHLLVKDTHEGVISKSMQLIAGRCAQEYNNRKNRKGAYWEDRYHATAIENDRHLYQCMVYIDLNMARAGVVKHPEDWLHSGYNEIQHPPKRYSIVDLKALALLSGCENIEALQAVHRQWVSTALEQTENTQRQPRWSSSVAVGSEAYVDAVQAQLGYRANGRRVVLDGDHYVLKEEGAAYNAYIATKKAALSE